MTGSVAAIMQAGNLYMFAGHNPVNRTDPWGLAWWTGNWPFVDSPRYVRESSFLYNAPGGRRTSNTVIQGSQINWRESVVEQWEHYTDQIVDGERWVAVTVSGSRQRGWIRANDLSEHPQPRPTLMQALMVTQTNVANMLSVLTSLEGGETFIEVIMGVLGFDDDHDAVAVKFAFMRHYNDPSSDFWGVLDIQNILVDNVGLDAGAVHTIATAIRAENAGDTWSDVWVSGNAQFNPSPAGRKFPNDLWRGVR